MEFIDVEHQPAEHIGFEREHGQALLCGMLCSGQPGDAGTNDDQVLV